MNSADKASRVLGLAFVLQFVTSPAGGAVLKPAWFVPENMGQTMVRIAASPAVMRVHILVDMITARGVTFLGVMLHLTLWKRDERVAMTALVLYVLEAPLLSVSGHRSAC
jgi:hypothetical protein